MKKYKGVIFDLDGTLVDTLYDIAECTNYALRQLKLKEFPVESYRLKVGKGNRELVLSCTGRENEHLVDSVCKMQLEHYSEHFCDNSRPYPGVMELLKQLRAEGLKMAVLSNKPAPFGPLMVKNLFGDEFFAVAHGQLDDVPLKPDPTSAFNIAEKLKLSPEEIAFVGDSAVDMQTACNASMFAVGVTWGFRGREELEQNGAQAIIDKACELSALLGL